MARSAKKTVYERIEDKQEEITLAESTLKRLNSELQDLFSEKDDLEMHQLLDLMKENGLTIDKAATLLATKNDLGNPKEIFGKEAETLDSKEQSPKNKK